MERSGARCGDGSENAAAGCDAASSDAAAHSSQTDTTLLQQLQNASLAYGMNEIEYQNSAHS